MQAIRTSGHPSRVLQILRAACYCLVLLGPSGIACAEIVVVAGTRSPTASLSKEQVADVYLAKNPALAPMDLPEASPLRDEFYTRVTGKSAAQAKSVWARLAFTGKAKPPKEAPNGGELKKLLVATPNAIGYIDKTELDSSVKVLFSVQ